MPNENGHARSQRLLDAESGRMVELVYALPADLLHPQADRDHDGWLAGAARIWRRWRAIAASAAVAMTATAGISLLIPNQYTATVVAMPPTAPNGAGGMLGQYADLAALAGIGLGQSAVGSVEEILAILDSRTLQSQLVALHELRAYYGAANDDELLRRFRDDFVARHDKKTNRISFAYTHHDPAVAADIANRAASLLQDRFNQIHHASSRREREFLEERQAAADRDLRVAQERLAQFQREHGTVELEAQTRATVEALGALQGQLIGQRIELRALLGSEVGDDNPQVRLMRQRIAQLDQAMSGLNGRAAAKPTGAGGEATTDAGVLLDLHTLPALAIEYAGLYREVKKQEALSTTLIAQAENARLAEVRDAEAISIIDPAAVPQEKSAPYRARMVLAGALLGALAAALWAWLRTPRRGDADPRP